MKKNISPISIVEQILFEKLGDTSVKVWHYVVLLLLLFIVPISIPSNVFSDNTFFTVFSISIIITWMSSRLVGRQLSKTSNIDSVLVYRFFAAASWTIPTILGWTSLLIQRISNTTERQFLFFILCFTTLVSLMHLIGIIIHFHRKDKLIRNVKKEDLFQ